MPTILLPLLPGTLPPGACYNSEQERLNAYAENLEAQLNGMAFFNYGSDVPAVENNVYPWLRTTDMLWYRYSGGWISPVGPTYDIYVRRLWYGTPAQLVTYDGGDSGAASDRSGPMWEEDINFRGRSPIGPGDVPGTTPINTISLGESFGAGDLTLAASNLPQHSHQIKASSTLSGGGFPQTGTGNTHDFTFTTEPAGGAGTPAAVSITHPVRGIYIIKWTGRLYRKV
jgi:hypothetical protein